MFDRRRDILPQPSIFKILDSEDKPIEKLYQWDANRIFKIEDWKYTAVQTHIYFSHKDSDAPVTTFHIKDENNVLIGEFPNILLKEDKDIYIYITTDLNPDEEKTLGVVVVPVESRPCPEGYIYDDNTEFISLEQLRTELKEVEDAIDAGALQLKIDSSLKKNEDNEYGIDFAVLDEEKLIFDDYTKAATIHDIAFIIGKITNALAENGVPKVYIQQEPGINQNYILSQKAVNDYYERKLQFYEVEEASIMVNNNCAYKEIMVHSSLELILHTGDYGHAKVYFITPNNEDFTFSAAHASGSVYFVNGTTPTWERGMFYEVDIEGNRIAILPFGVVNNE